MDPGPCDSTTGDDTHVFWIFRCDEMTTATLREALDNVPVPEQGLELAETGEYVIFSAVQNSLFFYGTESTDLRIVIYLRAHAFRVIWRGRTLDVNRHTSIDAQSVASWHRARDLPVGVLTRYLDVRDGNNGRAYLYYAQRDYVVRFRRDVAYVVMPADDYYPLLEEWMHEFGERYLPPIESDESTGSSDEI